MDAHAVIGLLPDMPAADTGRVDHPTVGVTLLTDNVAHDPLGSRRAAYIAEADKKHALLALILQ